MLTSGAIEERLTSLGLELPEAPEPIGEYVPAKQADGLVFVSGQAPSKDGRNVYIGQVGSDVSLEEAYQAAQLCVVNCLAALKTVTGSLDAVNEIIQVVGFVNSAPDFHDQPKVINGASELLVKLFGDRGRHTRAAVGTSSLPSNIPVEVLLVARVTTSSYNGLGVMGEAQQATV